MIMFYKSTYPVSKVGRYSYNIILISTMCRCTIVDCCGENIIERVVIVNKWHL